jgi:phosphodiesterase/alkaline phosphatase D-like protein
MYQISRRKFLMSSAATSAVAVLSSPLAVANMSLPQVDYNYPIPKAPVSNEVSFSVEVIGDNYTNQWAVKWEFATDPYFENIINSDSILFVDKVESQQLKVTLLDVPPGYKLYYRLITDGCQAFPLLDTPIQDDIVNLHPLPEKKLAVIAGAEEQPQLEFVI